MLTEFRNDLRGHFQGDIRLDVASRVLYSTDASIYQIEPLGVVLPRTQEDLQAVIELAAKYKVPILPRGSGSSLAGQAIGRALILDCSRWLNKLISINPEEQIAVVEPGLVLAKLNAAAEKCGLVFGPDPASAERATMGGVIGNNASGAHSIRYGMTADHLVSAEVIYADGSSAEWGNVDIKNGAVHNTGRHADLVSTALQIRNKYEAAIKDTFPHTWRNSAGYRLNYLLPWSPSIPSHWSGGHYPVGLGAEEINLAPLLAGSEGSLAVIKQAAVKLVPRPQHTILGVLAYDSIADACDDVPRLLKFSPSAVELVPQMLIRLARKVPAYAAQMDWVEGDPAALLIVEFSGNRSKDLRELARKLGPEVQIAESSEAQQRVWNVRKVGLGIFDSKPADARPVAFIEDCAIPVEKLGEFVREVELILSGHRTSAAFYAHASAGCLHIRPILNLKDKQGRLALRSIAEATLSLTLRLGGAMSSEHGDGIARAEFLRQTYGVELVDAMRLLKQAADPEGRLNPAKMSDAPPMDTHLRYGESYSVKPWPAALDFSRNNGLVGAIEQCNGQGVCRKDGSVMCPSFQATREEANSTRGRANLLRALINGTWTNNNDTSELEAATSAALDLCLACKGCKAECPSSVDMAKLKYEFLHEYHRTHRRRMRDYFFAFIGPIVNSTASSGSLINRFMELPFLRQITARLFGLTDVRRLPIYSVRNNKTHSPILKNETLETVILLRDTFTHFFEAEIELDVLEVLAACGIEAKILKSFGAGRTLLSKGFIDQARRHALRVIKEIQSLDPSGMLPILGIEPSELYTLRDEWFDLLSDQTVEVDALARRSWLAEEYLVRPAKNNKPRVMRVANSPKAGDRKLNQKAKIIFHGHCYQKARPPAPDGYPVGQAASVDLLRAMGFEVEIIPSGCCGMAGAFGYESEHYEVSMQVGELVLLPAVRKGHAEGNQIAATGTSCRSQIEHGADVKSLHPLQLIARALRS